MNEPLNIYFELEPDADTEAIRSAIKSHVARLEDVEEVDIQEPGTRLTGAEVIAVIGVAVLIANSAKSGIDALTAVVRSLRELATEVKGLRNVVFETNAGRRTLEEVKVEDLR